MQIKMTLLSDTIFGSGRSVPGDADLYPQTDSEGFPYMKGSTFKGIFRETLQLYLGWLGTPQDQALEKVNMLLGTSGSDDDSPRKMVFSDFVLSETVRERALALPGGVSPEEITGAMTNLRTFTSVDAQGRAAEGSLRSARCINKGVTFYSSILCAPEDEALTEAVLGMIKWVGTMRNRGFGKVAIRREKEEADR